MSANETVAGAPRVTIGMPVFNTEAYLAEAIESVLSQTVTDWRMIISDNASDDGTTEIAEKYAELDDRISVLKNEVNRGQSFNFRNCFEPTTTPYFMWLSGDDRLEPDYLQLCLAELETDSHLIGAYTSAVAIDSDSQSAGPFGDGENNHLRESSSPSERFNMAIFELPALVFFALYRSDVLRASNLLAPFVGSDRVLLAELALAGPTRKVDDIGFSRRAHSGSYSRAANSNRDRYKSYCGEAPPRFRILWATRLVKLTKAVFTSDASASERAKMLKMIYGRFGWLLFKSEVTLGIRTGGKLVTKVTGREVDFQGWLFERRRRKLASK